MDVSCGHRYDLQYLRHGYLTCVPGLVKWRERSSPLGTGSGNFATTRTVLPKLVLPLYFNNRYKNVKKIVNRSTEMLQKL